MAHHGELRLLREQRVWARDEASTPTVMPARRPPTQPSPWG